MSPEPNWYKPWVGGIRRVTTALTGHGWSPDGRWLAVWGRAREGASSRPGGAVHCIDSASGELGCEMPGASPVAALAFSDDETLWVLRYGDEHGAELSAYAVPDGGLLNQWELPGVGAFATLQVSREGQRMLVAERLGEWVDPDDRGLTYWYMVDTAERTVLSRLDPYTVWAWDFATGDVIDYIPWRAMGASLCPDGRRVAVRVDREPLRDMRVGALILLDGLDRRGVSFPGAPTPTSSALCWLGPTRVADLGYAGAMRPLLITDAEETEPRARMAVWEDQGRFRAERAEMTASPDGTRLLVSASRFSAGPCQIAVIDVARAVVAVSYAVPKSHPRTFSAAWVNDDSVVWVVDDTVGRVRVALGDPLAKREAAQRTIPMDPGCDLFRVRPSPDGRWVVLDWFDRSVDGWQLALFPYDGFRGV